MRAFTLTELLVVIAVIAVLLGVMLVALDAARERGRSAVCRSNLRQIGTATQMLLNDQEYLLPYFRFGYPRSTPLGRASPRDALEDYLDNPEVLVCPSDPAPPPPGEAWWSTSYTYIPGEYMRLYSMLTPPERVRRRVSYFFLRWRNAAVYQDRKSWHRGTVRNEVYWPDWRVESKHRPDDRLPDPHDREKR